VADTVPDGTLLVFRNNSRGQLQLFRYWPESGRLQEMPVTFPVRGFIANARALPGGKEALTFGSELGQESRGAALLIIDLERAATRRIPGAPKLIRSWGLERSSKSILAAVSADSLVRIVMFPMDGSSSARTLFTVTNICWSIEGGSDSSLYLDFAERPAEVVRLSATKTASETLASFHRLPEIPLLTVLPDARAVVPAIISGKVRLMAVAKGKNPTPLVNTPEETAAPLAVTGLKELAFLIGPEPRQTIALADTESGRIKSRISTDKGEIESLASAADGKRLYFAAGGVIWSIGSSGGAAQKIRPGSSVVVDPSGRSLLIKQNEIAGVRLFRISLDDGSEREIPLDRANPLMPFPLSPGALAADGRLIVALMPRDSWFNPIALLDTSTGRITRITSDDLSDHQSAAWAPDGSIVAIKVGLRSSIWRFRPHSLEGERP
jgi:hypothetical protein